jgi:calcineurin-like phosphoesterase family protein
MTLWFISDTHFGHYNMACVFKDADGKLIRGFSSVEEHDERMVAEWNSRVKPSDHVYHLGDVAMKPGMLQIVKRLNGHKRLVRGNHDIFKTKKYLEVGFEEIYGVRVLDNLLFTHIPVHPESLGRFKANVHGHIHEKVYPPVVRYGDRPNTPYINICVEHTGYAPVTLEDIRTCL